MNDQNSNWQDVAETIFGGGEPPERSDESMMWIEKPKRGMSLRFSFTGDRALDTLGIFIVALCVIGAIVVIVGMIALIKHVNSVYPCEYYLNMALKDTPVRCLSELMERAPR